MTIFQKIKIFSLILIFTALTYTPIAYAILQIQKDKKVKKVEAEANFYKKVEEDNATYRSQALAAINKTREGNLKKIEEARLTYDMLKQQQPQLLKDHTKQVSQTTIQTQYVTTTSTGSSSSSSSSKSSSSSSSSTPKPSSSKPCTGSKC